MSNDLWVKLMEFGKIAGCHQKPERSFFIKGCEWEEYMGQADREDFR